MPPGASLPWPGQYIHIYPARPWGYHGDIVVIAVVVIVLVVVVVVVVVVRWVEHNCGDLQKAKHIPIEEEGALRG